jgi:hypothetical protein
MSQRHERSMRPDCNGASHWLIRRAAHRVPSALSSRLEEEWLADLETRSTTLSRLRFAVGCCWASLVIENEYPRSRVAAASAVAPAGGFFTLVIGTSATSPCARRRSSSSRDCMRRYSLG